MEREDWYAQLSMMNLYISQIRLQVIIEKDRIASIEGEGAALDQAVEDLLLAERTLRTYSTFRHRFLKLLVMRYPMIKEREVEDAGALD